MRLLLRLLTLIRALAADRARLATENLLLRQQLLVLKRSTKRVRLDDGDRAFWVAVRRWLEDWKEHLVIVKPETVLRWHRDAFRRFWAARSAGKPGRPPVAPEVIALIRRLSSENVLWGAPRIASELALLGHEVADSTVAKYMVPKKNRPSSQTWRTPRLTARQVVAVLRRHGLEHVGTRGSHEKWRHPSKRQQVIVPSHRGQVLPLGTPRSILKGSGIADEAWAP